MSPAIFARLACCGAVLMHSIMGRASGIASKMLRCSKEATPRLAYLVGITTGNFTKEI